MQKLAPADRPRDAVGLYPLAPTVQNYGEGWVGTERWFGLFGRACLYSSNILTFPITETDVNTPLPATFSPRFPSGDISEATFSFFNKKKENDSGLLSIFPG